MIFLKKLHDTLCSTGARWKAATAGIALIALAGLAGTAIHQVIIASRTVTRAQVEQAWNDAGITMTIHTIKHGENFWKVAKEYGVDIDTIIGANAGIAQLHAATGQKVRVPNRKGVVHAVDAGDSVAALSGTYKVPPAAIITANGLRPGHILVPGLELFIPSARPVKLSGEMSARYSLRGIFGSPFPGRITSGMGMRKHPVGGYRGKHTGLDLAASTGTRIAAAAEGTVIETGEGEYIGKFVILSHKDAYRTVYGHCSQVLVRNGARVKRGQIIARVGSTGRTTGPHLHFEIRKNGVPQDPLNYLW